MDRPRSRTRQRPSG